MATNSNLYRTKTCLQLKTVGNTDRTFNLHQKMLIFNYSFTQSVKNIYTKYINIYILFIIIIFSCEKNVILYCILKTTGNQLNILRFAHKTDTQTQGLLFLFFLSQNYFHLPNYLSIQHHGPHTSDVTDRTHPTASRIVANILL